MSTFVVGPDPMGDTLAVIPVEHATAEGSLIQTLLASTTLGEVRTGDP